MDEAYGNKTFCVNMENGGIEHARLQLPIKLINMFFSFYDVARYSWLQKLCSGFGSCVPTTIIHALCFNKYILQRPGAFLIANQFMANSKWVPVGKPTNFLRFRIATLFFILAQYFNLFLSVALVHRFWHVTIIKDLFLSCHKPWCLSLDFGSILVWIHEYTFRFYSMASPTYGRSVK